MAWKANPLGSAGPEPDATIDGVRGRIRPEGKERRGRQSPASRAICIASGKGGTGKTFLASNLGVFLAAAGRSVLLLDTDFGLANLHILLGVHPQATLADVVEGRVSITDAIETSPFGPSLLSGASGLPRLAATSEQDLLRLAKALGEITGRFDVILLDGAAGLSPLSVSLALSCDELLLVTHRDLTALTDAYAVLKTVHGQDPALAVGVVINRVEDSDEGRRIFDRFAQVSLRFLHKGLVLRGCVPEDPAVALAVQARRPLLDRNPGSPAASAIRRIGLAILDGMLEEDVRGDAWIGFPERLGGWLRRG